MIGTTLIGPAAVIGNERVLAGRIDRDVARPATAGGLLVERRELVGSRVDGEGANFVLAPTPYEELFRRMQGEKRGFRVGELSRRGEFSGFAVELREEDAALLLRGAGEIDGNGCGGGLESW